MILRTFFKICEPMVAEKDGFETIVMPVFCCVEPCFCVCMEMAAAFETVSCPNGYRVFDDIHFALHRFTPPQFERTIFF